MHKLISIALLSCLSLQAAPTSNETLNHKQVEVTNKFYKKYLQKSCHLTAANFAQMHTQEEWRDMTQKKSFIEEVITVCPSATDTVAKLLIKEGGKQKFEYFRRFTIQYANDTGKFPPS